MEIDLALLADAHGANGEHTHGGDLPCAIDDELGHGAGVVDGLRVRHAGDAREAAGGRCGAAAGDVLLVLEAGFAQVNVYVDKPRSNQEPAGLLSYGPFNSIQGARCFNSLN